MSKKITSKKILIIHLLLFFSHASYAQFSNVETIAGTGIQDYSGDGGLATSAELNLPGGLVFDSSGNLYFSEISNSVVRKIDTNGIITTVAGIVGNFNDTGDGGQATSATLDFPQGLAVDAAGNLYIADRSNHKIRKVDTGGIITTIAGNGTSGFSGDGGQATSANLDSPQYVAVDNNNNIYISDWLNNRIRKVDPSGIITTYAGTGVSGFSGDGGNAINANLRSPSGIVVDAAGNVYFSDRGNDRIRKIDVSGIITTVAGSGGFNAFSGDGALATAAEFNDPNGLFVDSNGDIYIADRDNQRIRMVTASTGIINTIAGTGSIGFNGDGNVGISTNLTNPSSVAINSQGVYIADGGNHRIRLLPFQTAGVEDMNSITTRIYQDSKNNTALVDSKKLIKTIKVYDIIGKMVLNTNVNSNKYTFNMESLRKGIYIMVLKNETGESTFKILNQ